jgi:hypothetical protein
LKQDLARHLAFNTRMSRSRAIAALEVVQASDPGLVLLMGRRPNAEPSALEKGRRVQASVDESLARATAWRRNAGGPLATEAAVVGQPASSMDAAFAKATVGRKQK